MGLSVSLSLSLAMGLGERETNRERFPCGFGNRSRTTSCSRALHSCDRILELGAATGALLSHSRARARHGRDDGFSPQPSFGTRSEREREGTKGFARAGPSFGWAFVIVCLEGVEISDG